MDGAAMPDIGGLRFCFFQKITALLRLTLQAMDIPE